MGKETYISFIDNLAFNTQSVMHQASALSKILMVIMIISTVVITSDALVLVYALTVMILAFVISNLPVVRIMAFASYALFFSLVFAVSQVDGGILASSVIILKAVTAAVSLLLLITTTPYPQIFTVLQKIFPSVLSDAVLVTYRSFFILIEQMGSRVTAIRVRGGYSPLRVIGNLNSVGKIIGHSFIHAWELSEKMNDAMFVRGYKGKLPVSFSRRFCGVCDLLPIAIGSATLALALV